jgi:hypothetical protein
MAQKLLIRYSQEEGVNGLPERLNMRRGMNIWDHRTKKAGEKG